MARKSKLSQRQWQEVKTRILKGEKIRALSREYGIGESSMREYLKLSDAGTNGRVSPETIKEIAHKSLALDEETEKFNSMMESMTTGDRNLVFAYKANLMEVTQQLMLSARYSAQNSHRMARLAQEEFAKIDESARAGTNEESSNMEFIRKGIGLQTIANESAKIPLKVFEIATKQPPPPEEDKPLRIIGGLPDKTYDA